MRPSRARARRPPERGVRPWRAGGAGARRRRRRWPRVRALALGRGGGGTGYGPGRSRRFGPGLRPAWSEPGPAPSSRELEAGNPCGPANGRAVLPSPAPMTRPRPDGPSTQPMAARSLPEDTPPRQEGGASPHPRRRAIAAPPRAPGSRRRARGVQGPARWHHPRREAGTRRLSFNVRGSHTA